MSALSVSDPGLRDDGAMTGQNVWPDGVPNFRLAVMRY